MAAPHAAPQYVKSAARVLDVLELLAGWRRAMTHAEIAEHLGIPKSSLTQLLRNMVQRGYLAYEPVGRTYRIGAKFGELSLRRAALHNLSELAQPILNWLSATTGESAFLNVLVGDNVQLIARAVSSQPVASAREIGSLSPLYVTSSGKVILANLPDEMQKDYLERIELRAYTEYTIVSKKKLKEVLAEIRRTGWYFANQELCVGLVAFGAAILNSSGFPMGSLTVSLPTFRYSQKARAVIVPALQRAVHDMQVNALGMDRKPRRKAATA